MKGPVIVFFVFLFFLFLERIFPLRLVKMNSMRRIKDNLMLAALGIPFTRFLAYPMVYHFATTAELNKTGLFHQAAFPESILLGLSLVILDYWLYWWHRFNHRVSFLWRFHQVHHADPEMDASTALRFHFGELLLSSAVRVALIFALGFKLQTLLLFDVIVTSAALFHHSNLRMAPALENILIKMIVTPHFHQNHHSYFKNELDSNFSTIFSWWDKLHGTHTKELPTDSITIGLPFIGKLRPGLFYLLVMPVKRLSKWPKQFLTR